MIRTIAQGMIYDQYPKPMAADVLAGEIRAALLAAGYNVELTLAHGRYRVHVFDGPMTQDYRCGWVTIQGPHISIEKLRRRIVPISAILGKFR